MVTIEITCRFCDKPDEVITLLTKPIKDFKTSDSEQRKEGDIELIEE